MRLRTILTRGWNVSLEMSELLPGPPEVVWELITDWEHQDDWMLEASDFEVISEQRAGIGVRAEATIKIAGIKTRDEVRVVAWEPPKLLSIEHLGWVSGRGVLHLTPVAEGTHIYWREELKPPLGILGALGMTLFAPVMRRIFKRDLRILAALTRAATRSQPA